MGRKTWESIPPKFRPLPNRINVVLSRNDEFQVPNDVLLVKSLEEAAEKLDPMEDVANVFVIGGEQIYRQAIEQGFVNRVIYTEVANLPENTKFDAFFPDLDETKWDVKSFADSDKENGVPKSEQGEQVVDKDGFFVDSKSGLLYKFLEYTKLPPRNMEEMQYLSLCKEIMETGVKRGDRTGTGTLSKFGTQMRFSLRDGRLPLLTTKRTFWRGVAEELLWFISVCSKQLLVVFECLFGL